MRAIVTGLIGAFPLGGVAWDYGQYAVALERLGFDVYYLEDSGIAQYAQDPATGRWEQAYDRGARFIPEALEALSPRLARQWHFRTGDDRTYGIEQRRFADLVAGADLLLNVSGGCLLRDEYRPCRRKVMLDTDPGWNHFVIFPRWDAKPEAERAMGFRGHDCFFTYATRLGRPDCNLPTFGLKWHPTRPPVVRDLWATAESAGDRWTTVMTWDNFRAPIEHGDARYGSKELEFDKVEALPAKVPAARFEVAVGGEAPRGRWREAGWSVLGSADVSRSPATYRDYVRHSRGEVSVAKNVYVATGSGWFSCRSVCYLAAGRPVVVQDTGFARSLPVGEGLLSFSTGEEAADAVRAVEADYPRHARAAAEIAEAHFDADKVLREMLATVGLS